ncbi:WD40 repeat domain-containing protein [Actinoplanes sp. N902-109]|uniref:WD40 repeat domain-containing protein n=1 Tax=Actinoplanes sp. (strain N902-109) TaxID=649831 RepID=UPI00032959E5|nr:WD40 repeat domain-containing protein [Actinoplanes sp. N902-109]AGL16841.1 repetative protein [Actinoplanes sp. N902-109]
MTFLRYAAMAFRADARRLASSTPNGELSLWDTTHPDRPQPVGRLTQGRGKIVAAAWSPVVPELLTTTSSDGTGALWWLPDDRAPSRVAAWTVSRARPRYTGWLDGGRWVFSMTADGHTSVWDPDSGTRVGQAEVTGGHPVVAAHCRGTEVVAVTSSGWARPWHPQREPGGWIDLSAVPVSACAWSSTLLAVGTDDGRVTCVDAGFEPVWDVRVGPARPVALACSDEGRVVALSAVGAAVAVDPDGRVQWRTAPGVAPAGSLAIAGDLVAVGGGPVKPVLLTLATGVRMS